MSACSPRALWRLAFRNSVQLAVVVLATCAACVASSAQVHAQSVLSFKYRPAPRAQIAIWVEDGAGKFLSTVALTEAVGYRGIGNRPGASDMNSGYRWPYGRREGVLPVWAHRRASAPGARLFPRVIFQDRVEGLASRTTSDQSADSYFCLQFDAKKSTLDELDAVSCATPFTSDKGRYITARDVDSSYSEPYEATPGQGARQPLPLESYYPARMDVTRCTAPGCFDHSDVGRFADDVRSVMPDIDTVTIATPTGNTETSVLFTVPSAWSPGEYFAFIEVNVEGDYNDAWSAAQFPTPKTPFEDRDSFSIDYGFPYRGQPSLVWRVGFTLGGARDVDVGASEPLGRSSWNYWAADYGGVEPIALDPGAADYISARVGNSGVERLKADASGHRFVVQSGKLSTEGMGNRAAQPARRASGAAGSPVVNADGGTPSESAAAARQAEEPAGASPDAGVPDAQTEPDQTRSADVAATNLPPTPGAVSDLQLSLHENPLRAHTWIRLHMRAASSALALHAYEVRVATEPIVDEQTFLRNGRQAKTATDAKEGPSYLQLPTDVPAGAPIETAIGDLDEESRYYVGVRARDVNNRAGPLAFAEITTPARTFATVTPCFVATVAYGSPLARQVGALRRLRDRHLLSNAPGRRFVAIYYAVGGRVAAWLAPHETLRGVLRVVLAPLVALAEQLD